jgi:NADH dehydrogenase [ubiquinone] 1 alpha subcomplex assembly factor 6
LPPADIQALLDYTDATSGALVLLAMEALAGALEEAETEAGRGVGRAWALIGLLRAMPYRLQRGRIDLPASLAEKHRVDRRQMLNLKPSPELAAAAKELAGLARRELSAARALRRQVRRPARAALLPAALADGYLRRLARVDHNVFDRRLGDPPGLASLRLAYRSTIGRY